jgi:hypothetical protein
MVSSRLILAPSDPTPQLPLSLNWPGSDAADSQLEIFRDLESRCSMDVRVTSLKYT